MDKQGIQRAALAIARMRTPKAVRRARRDVERLRDWRRFTRQIDDPLATKGMS